MSTDKWCIILQTINANDSSIIRKTVPMADSPIKDHKPEPAYVTWSSDSEKAQAFEIASDAAEAYDGIMMSSGSHRSFLDIEPNRSVRSDFTRDDYYRFRQHENVPGKQKDIMRMCMNAYDKVGIIKNVIDLMGDFSSQGIVLEPRSFALGPRKSQA